MLDSPRGRRRLFRLGGATALAGAVAAAVVLVPARTGHRAESFANRAPQVYREPRHVRLTAVERRSIDRVLARWVEHAVARRNPLAAYALATPALRAGTTRSQWRRGELPVAPYTPRGRPGWRVDYAYPGDVVVDVVLQPGRGEKDGIIYTAELERLGGRWLVHSFVPSATFGGGRVYSHVDMGPQSVVPQPVEGRIAGTWILAPIAVLAALIIIVPVGIVAAGRLQRRRAFRSP